MYMKRSRPKKHEAQFQTKISNLLRDINFVREHFPTLKFPYELKTTEGKTLPFSRFEPQQIPCLAKAWKSCHHHKITDASLGIKPYDGYVFCKSPAYVGILFDRLNNKNVCYFIHIKYVLKLKEKKKSISIEDASSLGIKIILN